MEIVFHIGVHCTDDDNLIRSLLKNRDVLSKDGVCVPGPGRYRKILSETLQSLRGGSSSAEAEEHLLDTVIDDDSAERLVLSNQSFLCMPAKAIENGRLYPRAFKSTWLVNAFPTARCEFAVGLRNPATFIPALYEKLGPDTLTYDEYLGGADPRSFRWSDLVYRLRQANPEVPILVWCNEDTPLLWPEIMREVAGYEGSETLEGELDVVAKIMSREGMARLRAYMKEKPPANEITRRRVVLAFLDKFALREEIEQEISLPGWSDALVEELTQIYDEDMDMLARIPGVTFLAP